MFNFKKELSEINKKLVEDKSEIKEMQSLVKSFFEELDNVGFTKILLNIDRHSNEISEMKIKIHKLETIIGAGDYEYITKLEKKKEDWKK